MWKEINYFSHLKSKKFELIFIIFTSVIFGIIFYGNGIKLELIIYALIIALVFLLAWSYLSYLKLKSDYENINKFFKNDNLSFNGKLDGEIENLLIQRISEIKKNKSLEISKDKEDLKKMNEFYTLWAHQIKTPISAANLIIQDEGNLEDIQMEVLKIEDYVNVLLAYFRHHSYSTDYVFRQVSIDEVVRSALRKYSSIFIKKKISVEYMPCDLKIITDEKWLSFMVEQILSNSLKYTLKGKITIVVEDNSLVIRDTGIGIQESDLPRIFELGFTGYNGRIYSKSTGIGLNLVKSISESLNIDVKVTSQVDEFTEVRLRFDNYDNLTKM